MDQGLLILYKHPGKETPKGYTTGQRSLARSRMKSNLRAKVVTSVVMIPPESPEHPVRFCYSQHSKWFLERYQLRKSFGKHHRIKWSNSIIWLGKCGQIFQCRVNTFSVSPQLYLGNTLNLKWNPVQGFPCLGSSWGNKEEQMPGPPDESPQAFSFRVNSGDQYQLALVLKTPLDNKDFIWTGYQTCTTLCNNVAIRLEQPLGCSNSQEREPCERCAGDFHRADTAPAHRQGPRTWR